MSNTRSGDKYNKATDQPVDSAEKNAPADRQEKVGESEGSDEQLSGEVAPTPSDGSKKT